jgi:probable DNA metabolism protein
MLVRLAERDGPRRFPPRGAHPARAPHAAGTGVLVRRSLPRRPLRGDEEEAPAAEAPEGGVTVPTGFLELCHTVVLHSAPQRFALLYRLLWRLVHEPALRHDPLDADMLQARQMAQAVQRDMHKMHAFVRFRQVRDGEGDALDPLHVAWFEPEHHIVEANAPWFRGASPTCAGRS